jgi:hypothetical protein
VFWLLHGLFEPNKAGPGAVAPGLVMMDQAHAFPPKGTIGVAPVLRFISVHRTHRLLLGLALRMVNGPAMHISISIPGYQRWLSLPAPELTKLAIRRCHDLRKLRYSPDHQARM